VQEIANVSMNEPYEVLNLVIVYAEGFLMNDHQKEVPGHSHHPRKLCQSFSIHYFALELTKSSRGASDPV
jgi:hypothetical protein